MSDQFSYTVIEHEGLKLFEVSGYLSANTDIEFADFLETVTAVDNVIIDMKSVVLVTLSGIESLVLLSQNARKKGKRIILACLKPEIRDMFVSLSLYPFVIFADTVEEAFFKMRYYT